MLNFATDNTTYVCHTTITVKPQMSVSARGRGDLVVFEKVSVVPRDALLLGIRLDLLLLRNHHCHQEALQNSRY